MDIVENLTRVYQRLGKAAERAGRNPAEIQLLAVSKTMPWETVDLAFQAGQRAFAENRVQEWLVKVPHLPLDCQWHLVGRLQTNKVKYLNERLALIHSLDRINLLQELEAQGAKLGYTWDTLAQINIARDPAKAGLLKEEVEDFFDLIASCSHVRVSGFMTIGALEASPIETRGFFRELRLLRDFWQTRKWPGVDLRELSMGMSQDFEIAVEEGATMVRVGRDIFGERH
ncbi:MAG: YggS family pyridoxal phosphate-dependent enzyme [Desulfitobacteriaceae bacterium]